MSRRANVIKAIFSVSLTAVLTACMSATPAPQNTPAGVVQPSPIVTQPPTTQLPTSTKLPTVTPTANTALQRIVFGNPHEISWSSDSELLFYNRANTTWAYSTKTGLSTKLSAQDLELHQPVPSLLALVPETAESVEVSPSGNTVLYLVPHAATPKPTSTEGEVWLGGGLADLWILDSRGPRRLGEIENCIESYWWSKDETTIVVSTIPAPAQCLERAWLVNSNTNSVKVLFSKQDYPAEVNIYGISPDGRMLLYQTSQQVFILDLDIRANAGLERLGMFESIGGQWINNDQLLVIYRIDGVETSEAGIFSLRDSHLQTILSPSLTPAIKNLHILHPTVSPNGQWLAFLAGKNIYAVESLWVMNIEATK